MFSFQRYCSQQYSCFKIQFSMLKYFGLLAFILFANFKNPLSSRDIQESISAHLETMCFLIFKIFQELEDI